MNENNIKYGVVEVFSGVLEGRPANLGFYFGSYVLSLSQVIQQMNDVNRHNNPFVLI